MANAQSLDPGHRRAVCGESRTHGSGRGGWKRSVRNLASRLLHGDLDEEDRQENELSVREGFRVFSAYRTRLDQPLWCITESDRSATTLLLPSEY